MNYEEALEALKVKKPAPCIHFETEETGERVRRDLRREADSPSGLTAVGVSEVLDSTTEEDFEDRVQFEAYCQSICYVLSELESREEKND